MRSRAGAGRARARETTAPTPRAGRPGSRTPLGLSPSGILKPRFRATATAPAPPLPRERNAERGDQRDAGAPRVRATRRRLRSSPVAGTPLEPATPFTRRKCSGRGNARPAGRARETGDGRETAGGGETRALPEGPAWVPRASRWGRQEPLRTAETWLFPPPPPVESCRGQSVGAPPVG